MNRNSHSGMPNDTPSTRAPLTASTAMWCVEKNSIRGSCSSTFVPVSVSSTPWNARKHTLVTDSYPYVKTRHSRRRSFVESRRRSTAPAATRRSDRARRTRIHRPSRTAGAAYAPTLAANRACHPTLAPVHSGAAISRSNARNCSDFMILLKMGGHWIETNCVMLSSWR